MLAVYGFHSENNFRKKENPAILNHFVKVCYGEENIYRTRAIKTRSLYIFYPFFSAVYNQERLILQTIYVLNKESWD